MEEVRAKEEEITSRLEEVDDRERLWQEEKDEVNIDYSFPRLSELHLVLSELVAASFI